MFSTAANTINTISPTCPYNVLSACPSSTNKGISEYNYPGPFKSARKYAQDVMSGWVQEWLNK